MPLAKVQNPDRRAQQIVLGRLEQLVARIVVEDVDQRLAGVTSGSQARALDNICGLAPQQRDVSGFCAVRGRCEQPEEAVLAAHLAFRVEALDGDIVEIARPMHRRARRGSGHDQELRAAGIGLDLRRQRRKAGRELLALFLTQNAQARPGHDLQRVLTFDRDQLVRAIAEKSEMIGGEPCKEILAFGKLVGGERRRSLVHVGKDRLQPIAHRPPVGYRGAYIVEHADDVRRKTLQLRGFADAVDLHVNERLAPDVLCILVGEPEQHPLRAAADSQDGMHDQMQSQPVAIDFHRHRVDQEGHVVVDDLDDRVRRLPAVFLDAGIEHANSSASGLTLAREVPMRQRGTVQIGRRALGQLFRIHLPEVTLDEGFDDGAFVRRNSGPNEPEHFVETLRPRVVALRVHRCLLIWSQQLPWIESPVDERRDAAQKTMLILADAIVAQKPTGRLPRVDSAASKAHGHEHRLPAVPFQSGTFPFGPDRILRHHLG